MFGLKPAEAPKESIEGKAVTMALGSGQTPASIQSNPFLSGSNTSNPFLAGKKVDIDNTIGAG
jgi:hypothetical protein